MHLIDEHCRKVTTFLHQGEREHCDPKAWFKRTNKKNYTAQIARIERRRARLRRIQRNIEQQRHKHDETDVDAVQLAEHIPMNAHYIVGSNQNSPHDLQGEFSARTELPDPAVQVSSTPPHKHFLTETQFIQAIHPEAENVPVWSAPKQA
jgi:hypothetical protein